MSVRHKLGLAAVIGVAGLAGLAVAGPSYAGPSHAGATGVAASPVVTVTPSTNLNDRDVVVVRAGGFTPGATLLIGECAPVEPDVLACNSADSVTVTADGSGSARALLTVRRTFLGHTGPDLKPWGVVNCDEHPCGVGVATPEGEVAGVPITFRKVRTIG